MSPAVLILGRHDGMMQQVLSFLGNHGFHKTKGVLTNDAVQKELISNQYQILIIGGGVDADTRAIIRGLIATHQLSIKVIEHYGNPTGLIRQIEGAM